MFTPQEMARLATANYMLQSVTAEEQIAFINDQIADPFESGDTNYFKRLRKMVSLADDLDEICMKFFVRLQDVYADLTIDVSDYDQHLDQIFMSLYKFFVKNIRKLMRLFIREYVFNNRNRKTLTSMFTDSKVSSYPKEQYGKREYYILVTKLSKIVAEIFDDNIRLSQFIDYLERHGSMPFYVTHVKQLLEDGVLADNGVVDNIYKLYRKSDAFRSDLSWLEMEITRSLIIPYLEENKLLKTKLPPTEEIPEELDDEEDEDDG